ncbi:MAG TPA: rhodanese-like domain-containing protein, partial [Planctomycetota bacterium]|nr:rhodanese-like domain-containing protein [Planctomycetota bacterium]
LLFLGSRFLKAFSLILVVLAAGLFIFPSGRGAAAAAAPPAASAPGEAELLRGVEAAADHVEPEDLADRMMRGEEGLLVVDVRPAAEYAGFRLRGAVNVPIAELAAFLEPRRNQGTVVLYSNGMVHPAQARDSLARAGHANVFILTDGLEGFAERCLKPASLRPGAVTPAEAARINAWRAYFSKPDAPPARPARVEAPRAELPGMVSAGWLAANLGRAGLKAVDLREQKDYNGGHIPDSLSLHPESLRGNVGGLPSMLLPAGMLAEHFSLMGIEPADTVVFAFSGDKLRDATLAGMACERLGHARWAVLDGGWEAWLAGRHPTDALLPAARRSKYPAPAAADRFTVDYRTVLAELGPGTVIIDVRPADFYSGKKRDEARGGHIPGAVNRDFALDLAPKGSAGSLMPTEELAAAYAALIPSKDSPVIVHCRTGHQASQTFFVLKHVLGYRSVRWYDAGWTEWAARAELPVE